MKKHSSEMDENADAQGIENIPDVKEFNSYEAIFMYHNLAFLIKYAEKHDIPISCSSQKIINRAYEHENGFRPLTEQERDVYASTLEGEISKYNIFRELETRYSGLKLFKEKIMYWFKYQYANDKVISLQKDYDMRKI